MTSEQVIVVGGGPAGCACAIEAASLGLRVLLVDEHPQSTAAMSFDAPYFYGARLAPSLSDTGAVADAVLGSNEPLMQCLQAGVEVLTGTCVWGVFRPDAGNPGTRGRQVGLADKERSWIVNYDYLVLAPGARDLVLSFPNWQLPGVLGAKGALALLQRYQALGGRKMLVLGSSNLGLEVTRQALYAGIELVGIVEPSSDVQGDTALADEIRSRGCQFYLRHTIRQAMGRNEVEVASLVPLSENGEVLSDQSFDIACDTICMAFGAVPNIELASVAGCKIHFDAAKGGWVPLLGPAMEASEDRIYVVGKGAGVSEHSFLGSSIAEEQGRRAARAIAARESLSDYTPDTGGTTVPPQGASSYPPSTWLETLIAAGGVEVVLCQCEEVTRRELMTITPPKYLHAGDSKPAEAFKSLTEMGQSSQDLLKRLTRVGMGHCQGKRCRDQGAMLLARSANIELSAVTPGSYRVPVRPLPLSVAAAMEETPEERANWTIWLHEVRN